MNDTVAGMLVRNFLQKKVFFSLSTHFLSIKFVFTNTHTHIHLHVTTFFSIRFPSITPIPFHFVVVAVARPGSTWSACLVCSDCQLALSVKCYIRNGQPYCKDDFYKRFAKTKCANCELGRLNVIMIAAANSADHHHHHHHHKSNNNNTFETAANVRNRTVVDRSKSAEQRVSLALFQLHSLQASTEHWRRVLPDGGQQAGLQGRLRGGQTTR